MKQHLHYYSSHLDHDIPAGVVVFLVALPLCLGIATASGAPPLSGVIAGVIGGLVVSIASGSQLSVSGPAAGLTVIVATTIEKLGFEGLLLAVALSGLLQFAMGFLRAGVIGAYFPSAVIKGMLAAIGLILIMKQIPHAIGYDVEAESDPSFLESDDRMPLRTIFESFKAISPGAVVVSIVSLTILLLWETSRVKRLRLLALAPAPLIVVLFGVAYNAVAQSFFPSFGIARQHLVTLPMVSGPSEFARHLILPDFSQWQNPQIYITAATLALVGSLETLLSLEAVEKLDPLKRSTPTNQELKAQGLGNFLSGMLGGLPLTAVIVRSSANIDAGAHTKAASFIHGALLLLSVIFLPDLLNMIPLACLAAVLLLTGYKLAKPKIAMEQYKKGFNQFAPFAVTIIAILLTDLLKGMALGMAVGFFFVLRANYHRAFALTKDGRNYLLPLQKDVSFLNRASLRSYLQSIETNSSLMIDGTRATFIDQDILETLEDFIKSAEEADIKVETNNVLGLSPANKTLK
ncbi:SulP family inorganic anion transporter [Methylocystis sp.]|uniref:SulP family inorganic anion transporter n=1 Tax=Methylocystis sp. TaxID=1911079 RepID=UPI0025CC0AF2|nr:SulP family inorganic anion transporter [Methylocystis sp.]